MNLREQYKEKFGKYPSSQMKEETLLKKLNIKKVETKTVVIETPEPIIQEKKEVKEIMKLKTRTVKGYVEPKEGNKVLKMTSRRRAYLLKNK